MSGGAERSEAVLDATLAHKIQRVVSEYPAWDVRSVWAFLRRLRVIAG